MEIKEAIILAGGFGTRLRSVVQDIPKPMAPIGDIPFLEILMDRLVRQGIEHIVLAVGYKYEVIEDYFGSNYEEAQISYAIEKEPLGTGGAILLASNHLKGKHCFVLNGDTLFDVDLSLMADNFKNNEVDAILALKEIVNQDRYGTVRLDKSRIISFEEKTFIERGYINGGVYLLSPELLRPIFKESPFSLEKDYFEVYVGQRQFHACIFDKYFIDIGIPSDYERAQKELEKSA